MDTQQTHNTSTTHKSGKIILIILIIILVILIAGGLLYFNSSLLTNRGGKNAEPTITQSNHKTVYSYVITATNYSFTPSNLTVKKGETVEIVFKSKQGTHNLNIDAFNVHTIQIGAHGQESLQFTPDRTGTFEIYSSFGNDKAKGMKGTLIVQ